MKNRFRSLAALGLLVTGFLVGCDSSSSKVSSSPAPAEEPAAPVVKEPVKVSLPEKISFNEHVQPILSEYCYHCHGPDSGTREPKKAPLRLDRMEDAFVPREDGNPVILKGNPAESELVKRLHEKDPDSIMPPPKSHKTMGPREIALLERWIEQGAEYEPHWSFAQVKRPELSATGAEWAANPIDRFVAENSMTPA